MTITVISNHISKEVVCKGVVWFCYGSFMKIGANTENVLFKNKTKKAKASLHWCIAMCEYWFG